MGKRQTTPKPAWCPHHGDSLACSICGACTGCNTCQGHPEIVDDFEGTTHAGVMPAKPRKSIVHTRDDDATDEDISRLETDGAPAQDTD